MARLSPSELAELIRLLNEFQEEGEDEPRFRRSALQAREERWLSNQGKG